jgi:hypothetical protein
MFLMSERISDIFKNVKVEIKSLQEDEISLHVKECEIQKKLVETRASLSLAVEQLKITRDILQNALHEQRALFDEKLKEIEQFKVKTTEDKEELISKKSTLSKASQKDEILVNAARDKLLTAKASFVNTHAHLENLLALIEIVDVEIYLTDSKVQSAYKICQYIESKRSFREKGVPEDQIEKLLPIERVI